MGVPLSYQRETRSRGGQPKGAGEHIGDAGREGEEGHAEPQAQARRDQPRAKGKLKIFSPLVFSWSDMTQYTIRRT